MTDDEVAGLLHDWHRHGVICGVVTDGPNPVSILYRGGLYSAIPPHIIVVNADRFGRLVPGRPGRRLARLG